MSNSPLNDLIRSYEALDDRLRLMGPEFLKTVKAATEGDSCMREVGIGFARAPDICLSSDNFNADIEVKKSLDFIIKLVWAIKSMGFDINILSLHWHNVRDSCYNIMGDHGCFCIKYEFKEKKTEENK